MAICGGGLINVAGTARRAFTISRGSGRAGMPGRNGQLPYGSKTEDERC